MSKQMTEEEKQNIIAMYVEDKCSVRKISQTFHRGENTIKNILIQANVYKTKRPTEAEKELMINLYLNGYNVEQIHEKTKRGSNVIRDILKEAKVFRGNILTIDEEKRIVDLYVNQGYSQVEIEKIVHRGSETIKKVLIKYNVHKTRQETNISHYKINENFFDINNQNYDMAYVLGMIASDGCISRVDNQVYIELQRSDREVLEKINNALQNERPVKDYITGRGYENSKIYFYNCKMKQDLALFHLIPNKTYDKEYSYPNLLKEEYQFAFIRGLFDGDGSIYINNQGTPGWQIDTSSKEMRDWICEVCKKAGIGLNKSEQDKKNVILYRCKTSDKHELAKLYQKFYLNPDEQNPIYMQRKKDKFDSISLPILK